MGTVDKLGVDELGVDDMGIARKLSRQKMPATYHVPDNSVLIPLTRLIFSCSLSCA